MSQIQDRRVLITGSARGMGREMARLFALERAKLVLVDIDAEGLQAAADELRRIAEVSTFVCDVSTRENVSALREGMHADAGPIDILVNNAGVIATGAYESIDAADEDQMLRINALGSHYMTRTFLPDLIASKEGHLVQMASASAIVGIPYHVFYGATKSFVSGLAEALRQELKAAGRRNVHVTVVSPSVVNTTFYENPRAPFMAPIVDAELVARRVVAAVRKNRPYVREPFMVKTAPLLRAVLPVRAADFLGRLFGTHRIVRP